MGYTRYFEGIKASEELANIAAKVIELSPAVVRGWDGTGEPIVTAEKISLNGDAATDQWCETFSIGEDGGWDCCKTGREPYDEVVAAILLAGKRLNPEAKVTSDGPNGDDGSLLYRAACEQLQIAA